MIKTNNVSIWTGVVVNVNDPLKANRVKVRIFGLHTNNETDIKNDDLQWAIVNMPATGASTTGIGTNHVLKQGALVLVTFIDGTEMQIPLVLGSINGIQTEQFKGLFTDPDGIFPLEDRLGEPDVNRLARNESIDDTIIQQKRDSIDTDVPQADGESWSEPESPYNTVYPFNQVTETQSGHIIEIDDTDGAERLHIWHKSGTSVEIHPDGTTVTRIVKDKYKVITGTENIHIQGNSNITTDGNTTLYTKGDVHLLVDGNVTGHVKGNVDATVDGNVTALVKGNVEATIDGNFSGTIKGNMDLKVNGGMSIDVDGSIDIKSGSAINMNAPVINEN